MAGEHFAKAWNAEHLLRGLIASADAVAEQDKSVAGFELEAHNRILRFRHEAHGIRTLGEYVLGHAAANQKRRRVSRIDIFEMSLIVEDPKNIVA